MPPPPLSPPASQSANGRSKRTHESSESTRNKKLIKTDSNSAAPVGAAAAAAANSDVNDDENHSEEEQASQAMEEEQSSQAMFEDDEEWEKGASKAYVELEVPKTLAEMSFKLRNGSIEVGLHEENRDHVFHLVNNKLGKPILLFPQGMSKLLTECLPKAYEIYDASEKDSENIDDGTIYSETLVLSKYVKNVVEVSVYKKQLYVFLKRLGKPDAMKKTSIYTGTIKAYTGPKIEPDKDGFIPMKSCSIQFDRETDDPAEILVWARKCMTIPF